ncbi:polycystic kidney disease 1 like 1 [Megalops cyprinoides]|uniref:polycystic kidney disease 1 like 1 n=1 Tax=Megalops cyprinoides TaxID=118141 RepID=UPI001863EB2B|nr:polycystic kidney disease 1 like 1 [Megalops cyprinoides]
MGDQTTYVNKGPVVSHVFLTAAEHSVSVTAQNRVGSVTGSASVSVLYRMQPVRIHTDKQVYATGTDITFLAVTEEPGPLEFLWHFGDRLPQRSTSRTITKRYYVPGRYNVILNASNGLGSFTSDIYPIVIQREVKVNRLQFYTSVLLNASVNFDCRINAGTNVRYHWSFGDGTYRIGSNTEQHVFHRTGEFTVQVTVSNLVSSASLMGQIFVVRQPCQPPPVKNMGPLKLQVRRYQTLRLGVTYEADIQCNISQGLLYSWAVYESGGLQVQLPPIEAQKQSIELPNNFLHYGTYTAVARVQIQGSIVYSNYTVRIEVVPSPPVSLIYGGTNIFISNSNGTILTLNGQGSHDPDYPQNILSYTWDCEPVSGIQSPCFDEHVPTSHAVLMFPVSFLKPSFDQFQFRLTVRSGDRAAVSEVFVTISPSLIGNVNVYCYQCLGSTVNWNEQFSVKAQCENCGVSSGNIFYTWKLYLVNASSKVVVDVPFCNSVDLSLPSRLVSVLPPAATLPTQTTSGALPTGLSLSTTPVPLPDNFSSPQITPGRSTVPAFSETPWAAEDPGSQYHTTVVTSSNTTSTNAKPSPTTVPAPPTTPFLPVFPPFPFPFPEEDLPSGGRPRRERSAEPQRAATSSDHATPAEPAPDSGRPPPVPGDYDIPVPPYYISEFPVPPYDGSIVYGGPAGESDFLSEFPYDPLFPSIFESSEVIGRPVPPSNEGDVDYRGNATVIGEDEGGASANQTLSLNSTGAGSGSSSGVVPPGSSGGWGHNLVDPSNQLLPPAKKTLLDLNRELIDPDVFQTFTLTGITSPIISFKPFVLKTKSLYMLEVSANSQETLLGKTQLFFSTNEIPEGMTCQVQPSKGYEIHTDFSIFCTSGKEDLLYEYSFSVGNTPRKILYQGRDFQYYFNLPSGDPDDDYKVMIYTEIRNRFGAATRPCPVSVKVLPSFQRNPSSVYDPEKELYVYGIRNLTKLMQMGNSIEIRNYIILLTSMLNRLSGDPAASLELQTATRGALISTVCQLTISDQATMIDNIYMLKELMRVTTQVTFDSARLVTRHIRVISACFHEPNVPVTYYLDEWTLNSLVPLLSHALEASFSSSDESVQLTSDGIRTATELMLKYVLFSKALQYTVSTSLMELKTSQLDSLQTMVDSVGSTTFYLPDALGSYIDGRSTDPHGPCVISQLTLFKQNPYFWAKAPVQINGDIAGLTLYNCSTRREMKVYSLSTPVNIEFQKRASNVSGASDLSLLRSEMIIHRFNVSPENLQEMLQITVEFTQPASFPIMFLFRMFERPTPSLYNIKKIHRWEGNTVHIFLPPSTLTGAGTGYLAILNADYNRNPRNKYVARAVNYTMRIESTRCLSWDGVREWRAGGCTPTQGLSPDKVNCSLVDNLTLCIVIAISLAVYLLVMVVCKLADIRGEEKAGLVLLQDNSPLDRQLYAVTIDTGFRSRPAMTAKVHIVLHGDDGVSQTRELNFPDNLPFERNSRRTFILSTPESLGPIWKVHLWHDNSGCSPSWYISYVLVKDLVRGSSWFFPGECWLAVDEGDGRVERELTPLTRGLGFMKLLYSKLTEYLEDFHLWASVYSRPSHSGFTHVQRLSVCLLLLEGYMCANTVVLSRQDDQYTAELGLIDVSAVSLATGILSTLAVLPVGGLVSLLFRLSKRGVLAWCPPSRESVPYGEHHGKKAGRSDSDRGSSGFEDGSYSNNSKLLGADFKQSQCDFQSSSTGEHGCVLEQQEFGSVTLPSWCRCVAWGLCLSLSLSCAVLTAVLGTEFSTTKSLLWIHSLFFSLLCCAFVVQPALILIIAAVVSLWYRESCDFCSSSNETEPVGEKLKLWSQNGGSLSETYQHSPYHHVQHEYSHLDRVLAARQRARHLRLTRPPTRAELRSVRDQMRKEGLIRKTLREATFYIVMLCLLLSVTYGKSSKSQYQLNQAVRTEFTRHPRSAFQDIKTHEDWWNWASTTLLDGLYGDMWYNKVSARNKVPSPFEGLLPACLPAYSPSNGDGGQSGSVTGSAVTRMHRYCGHVACYGETGTRVSLGSTSSLKKRALITFIRPLRSAASARLQELRGGGWLDRRTRTVLAQFTLYNPPTNLFTTVSLMAEQPATGGLLPSAFIQSVRVYQTASTLDYIIMACELLFLLFTLLQLYFQICAMSQKGLLSYWRDTCNWLEVTIIIISLLYYVYYVYHFVLTVEIIDHLQRENFKAFVDLSFFSSWEQLTHCLHGVIVFLFLVKSVFILQTNIVMAPSVTLLKLSLSKLWWPLVTGVILMVAFSCLGNLLFQSTCHPFSSMPRSFQTVIKQGVGVIRLKTLSALYQSNDISIFVFSGSFFFIVTIVWTALIIGILTPLAKTARNTTRRKYLVTFSEVVAYIQDRLLVLLGRRGPRWIDNHAQRSNFYLEEFENLVDELLFRLNALSNSLHHTLPNKEQSYREDKSPPMSLADYTCSLHSENTAAGEDGMRKKTSKIEGMLFRNTSDLYNLFLCSQEDLHDQNFLSSKLELETLKHLQQNLNKSPASDGFEGSCSPERSEGPEKEATEGSLELSAALPGSVELSYSSASDTPAYCSSFRSDCYDLLQPGGVPPHALRGMRCPEIQGGQPGSQDSRMRDSTANLWAKNRKVLRRSHTAVIQPLRGSISRAWEGALSQGSTAALSSLSVQSHRSHHWTLLQRQRLPNTGQ